MLYLPFIYIPVNIYSCSWSVEGCLEKVSQREEGRYYLLRNYSPLEELHCCCWIDSLQSNTLTWAKYKYVLYSMSLSNSVKHKHSMTIGSNIDFVKIENTHQYWNVAYDTFFLYLSNCAFCALVKNRMNIAPKFISSSLEAHGWEVDTLAVFLWDPMHKNDLKSPSYFTYSSLTARKSEMINWNWDFHVHNSARITHEFWTFQQPAWNLCFFYECWIDLAAGSWLTSRLKRNVQIYLHTYLTIPIPI